MVVYCPQVAKKAQQLTQLSEFNFSVFLYQSCKNVSLGNLYGMEHEMAFIVIHV